MIPFDILFFFNVILQISVYIPITLFAVLMSVLVGTFLGAGITKLRLSKLKVNRLFGLIYVFTIRCTPSLIMLFLVFYGLPKLFIAITGIDIDDLFLSIFVIISFSLIFAANISEVFRASYLSIDKGQIEAGLSIGLTNFQTLYRIILPQSLIYILPNYCVVFVNLIKNTSLAYTIGFIDIMGCGDLIIGRNYGNHAIETYLAISIIYISLIFCIEKLFKFIEAELIKNTNLAKNKE